MNLLLVFLVVPSVTALVVTPEVLKSTQFSVGGFVISSPPRTELRATQEISEEVEEEVERLASPAETLAAAAIGTGLAAAAGLQVLDAGAVTSSMLVGAALAWAAENEKDYGLGDVARGIGKLGHEAFKAARFAQENTQRVLDRAATIQAKFEKFKQTMDNDFKLRFPVVVPPQKEEKDSIPADQPDPARVKFVF